MNRSSRVATIGGSIAVFLAATAAFAGLQHSLARIWELPATPGQGIISDIRNFLKNFFTTRLLAFVVMVLLGVLLVASLFLGAVLSFVESYMPSNLPAPTALARDWRLPHFLYFDVASVRLHLSLVTSPEVQVE